ncbi:MAG: hypothetical protein V3R96_00535 [Dehalococcoidales bacterium]
MSKILKIINIIAIVIMVLFLVSILMMPYPANIILGGLILISFILILVNDRMTKKREKEEAQRDEYTIDKEG